MIVIHAVVLYVPVAVALTTKHRRRQSVAFSVSYHFPLHLFWEAKNRQIDCCIEGKAILSEKVSRMSADRC